MIILAAILFGFGIGVIVGAIIQVNHDNKVLNSRK